MSIQPLIARPPRKFWARTFAEVEALVMPEQTTANATRKVTKWVPNALWVRELGLPQFDVPVEARVDPMWTRGGACRDGARAPLPWTEDAALNHGFRLGEPAAGPWLPIPAGWGIHAVEGHEHDPESVMNMTKAAPAPRRQLCKNEVFTTDDGATLEGRGGKSPRLRAERPFPRLRRNGNRTGAPASWRCAVQRRAARRGRLPPA